MTLHRLLAGEDGIAPEDLTNCPVCDFPILKEDWYGWAPGGELVHADCEDEAWGSLTPHCEVPAS